MSRFSVDRDVEDSDPGLDETMDLDLDDDFYDEYLSGDYDSGLYYCTECDEKCPDVDLVLKNDKAVCRHCAEEFDQSMSVNKDRS